MGCDLFAAYMCVNSQVPRAWALTAGGNLILFSGKIENGIFLKGEKEAVSYKLRVAPHD